MTPILEEVGYKLRTKKVTTPRKAPTEQQVRDTFQTPRYATELLLPFIPKHITHVWECAAGEGRISRILEEAHYTVLKTDLKEGDGITRFNFLEDGMVFSGDGKFSIITNPPFSIKDLFIERCFEYGVPFALLINADYSGWQIELVQRGCEKIIPNRRINYLTPFVLQNVHEGEVWELVKTFYPQFKTLKDVKDNEPDLWAYHISRDEYKDVHKYSKIDDVPDELLAKYSASQFHSMWLTYGFGIGRTETFVDLPKEVQKTRVK